MKDNQYRREREEMNELLRQYNNFKTGRKFNFIEEESFHRLVDYFDENDNLSSALEAINFALDQFPYSASLYVRKADILIATQRFYEGLEILNKAEVLDSNDINVCILKTDAYLALGFNDKAEELLAEALESFEGAEKTDLLFELADVYDDYEQFEKVFHCLHLILKEDPVNEEALYKICFWADYTGKNEESIEIHQQIIEENPYSHLAWFNLGTAYQGLKLHEKAIDAYQYCIAIDEKFDYAYRNMGDAFLKLKKYREAIESLQKVLELSVPEGVIYEAIGYCYERLKSPTQARSNYRKALHLNPEESRLFYKIATTFMEEEYWESAIKNLESALNINRTQPEYHFAFAVCCIPLGRIKEAVIHFTQFIKARPKNTRGWKELITCLYDAGYYMEALEQVYNAQKNTENKPVFYFYKAAVLFELEKPKEALLQLQLAMQKAPALVKHFVALNPSFLQRPAVSELISNFKKHKAKKK